jgi:predicted permease
MIAYKPTKIKQVKNHTSEIYVIERWEYFFPLLTNEQRFKELIFSLLYFSLLSFVSVSLKD